MRFDCQIDINSPIGKVVDIFLNPDNLKYVQDGFKSKTLIRGAEGKKGAVSTLVYEKLELQETILINNLPKEFLGLYEHKYTTNTMRVSFEVLNDNTTRYHSEIDYTELKGFMVKIMATLFPGMFKKQVEKWMLKFKNFAEQVN
ncbi:SRPBCC family protein [Ichthyenterobacterium sp. W332]|uniref:SRPBCC family protein n=1 Tax=Microcosmobacter mediterraneus TaxID=3075607 RepID=A0ABU2YKB5_9FLAO|nr:SRPBCC family protein [Ichthyenterobacterium sp. W332]MDT0557665.1 SRPBCC family protein [Ichthyenterobacterium sp. W332]